MRACLPRAPALWLGLQGSSGVAGQQALRNRLCTARFQKCRPHDTRDVHSVLLLTFLKQKAGRCGRRSAERCLLIGTNAWEVTGRGLLPFNLAIHSIESHMGPSDNLTAGSVSAQTEH